MPKNNTLLKPLKIAFVLDDSLDRPDGVQQYVKTLGNWLIGQGHTVHYLVGQSKSGDHTVHSLSKNIAIRFNKNRLSIPLPARKSHIRQLLDTHNFDVLHVQMPYNPALAGRVIRAASPDTAVVATFHILPFGSLQRAANKTLAVAQKRSFARLDAICSVSSAAAEFARKTYGIDSHVIPNMLNLSAWQTSVKPHPHRVVYLGRLVQRKCCREFLAALTKVSAALRAELEVIIAGDGPERAKLEQYAQDKNLQNIRFIGFIDEQAKPDLLASAEIAVFPSLGGESFGIVLIEAMAAGAGVVLGGDNAGYRTVLGEWPEVLVDPVHSSDFARRLEKLLVDQKLRSTLHRKQQQAVTQYDTGVAGQQILRTYATALQSRRNLQ